MNVEEIEQLSFILKSTQTIKNKNKTMKEYKVESLIYYSKFSFDKNHNAKKSKEKIQE